MSEDKVRFHNVAYRDQLNGCHNQMLQHSNITTNNKGVQTHTEQYRQPL